MLADPVVCCGISIEAAITLFRLKMIAAKCWGQYSGMTALMIAVVKGDLKIVRSLLDAGAAVNVLTQQGTALSLAAKYDSGRIIQLLLAKNASLEDAISVLSTEESTPTLRRVQAIQTLERLAFASKEKKAGDLLRQLYSEFSSEHAHISEMIRESEILEIIPQIDFAPGNVKGFLPSWAQGIERRKGLAWKAGMSILRNLIRGQVPKKVGEVVMLLTVVKSMSTILDFRDGELSDSRTKFTNDLARWQRIFHSEDGSLQQFRNAVHVLRGVKLSADDSIHGMPPEADQLTSLLFQTMAMNLIAKMSPILHSQDNVHLGNDGLLESQSRWKASHGTPSCGPRNFVPEHREEAPTLTYSRHREDDPDEFSRRFSLPQRSSVVEFEPIFIVLTSGAIFGILVLFLISKFIRKNSFMPIYTYFNSLTAALSQY